MGHSLQTLAGLAGLIAIAWALSEDRRAFPWRPVVTALAVQALLAVLLLNVPPLWRAVAALGQPVAALDRAARAGSSFIFGYLGGAPLPFDPKAGANSLIIAFEILPIVIVTSAVASLLWHWRLLPLIVRGLRAGLERSLGLGGAAAFGLATTLFFGVVEAPLFVRAYLERLSRAELFLFMTAGLSTISGVVLVLYAGLVDAVLDRAVGHLVTASLMSLPAALMVARILVPGPLASGASRQADRALHYDSSLEAITRGTLDGLQLFLAVIAILITVFAFVNLADQILAFLPDIGGAPVTLTRTLSWLLTPLMLLTGIGWEEAPAAASLMATKMVLNEFVAFQALPDAALSGQARLIMTYALCGFANLASVGMLTATLSTLAPDRRKEIVGLGMRAWVAGNLATLITGTVAGLVRLP